MFSKLTDSVYNIKYFSKQKGFRTTPLLQKMGACSHSDLTSQVLQKLHKMSTYWAFTKDRTVPHSNGQQDQKMRQGTPANLAACMGESFTSFPLLFLIPLTWATFSTPHLSITLNKTRLFSSDGLVSQKSSHKPELAGISPSFFGDSALPCDKPKH